MRARSTASRALVCAACATWAGAMAADVGRSKFDWLTRYASTNAAARDPRFAALARGTAPSFSIHDGIANPRLADRFLAGLGGPPDPVRLLDDRYLVLGACVPHDCGSKSLLWIDPVDDLRIGAVAGVGYDDHRTTLVVFSRSIACARIPPAFDAALTAWRAELQMVVVSAGFVGPNGRMDTSCVERYR